MAKRIRRRKSEYTSLRKCTSLREAGAEQQRSPRRRREYAPAHEIRDRQTRSPRRRNEYTLSSEVREGQLRSRRRKGSAPSSQETGDVQLRRKNEYTPSSEISESQLRSRRKRGSGIRPVLIGVCLALIIFCIACFISKDLRSVITGRLGRVVPFLSAENVSAGGNGSRDGVSGAGADGSSGGIGNSENGDSGDASGAGAFAGSGAGGSGEAGAGGGAGAAGSMDGLGDLASGSAGAGLTGDPEDPANYSAGSAALAENADAGAGEHEIAFAPYHTENTDPSNLISYTEVQVDGQKLSSIEDYVPVEEIQFGLPEAYTNVEGVITFRGNNFRNAPAYGTVEFGAGSGNSDSGQSGSAKDGSSQSDSAKAGSGQSASGQSDSAKAGSSQSASGRLESIWEKRTGSLTYEGKTWSGNGWTGQPLIIRWPDAEKKNMNLYPEAKAKAGLTEVIYPGMDGNINFMDLETGAATRDPIHVGWTFKGAGALDPRGLPILYVGSGYDSANGKSRVFVISLIDGSILYTFGNNDNFSLRGQLSYFDSSPLVDAETDTLIYPGENGILYLIHLNTQYDAEAGTLSIAPDRIVKWHYMTKQSAVYSYWLGMEDSAAIYKGYLFIADNGGRFMCLDLNTLQLVWVQNILDDSNSTPVLSIEDGHLYAYISTSFHKGWRSSDKAEVPIWKIDAENGEIVWQTSYTCTSAEGVSGGVESTIACGENELAGCIYCTVSKTTGVGTSNGVLCCLDKKTGEIVWEHYAPYSWSSPVCIYNSDGQGRVIYATSSYHLYMLDGLSGSVLFDAGFKDGTIAASPAVFNDIMVLGCRGCTIRGFRIS